MPTIAVTKPFKDQPSRTCYQTGAMASGDDSAPIVGLIGNDVVVVALAGTVTSVMVQTRLNSADAWVPCASAVQAAAGSVAYFNVLDQLRVLVTTGTAVVASILVRRPK
jgi:hypothetical protein